MIRITSNWKDRSLSVEKHCADLLYKAERGCQNLFAELAHRNNTFKATSVERLIFKKKKNCVFYVKAFIINVICLNVGQHVLYIYIYMYMYNGSQHA
jgi:hypothetical protein